MRKFMLWIELDAFIECPDGVVKLFFDGIGFAQSVVSWDMSGADLNTFL
jgi:hypothetical protein